METRAGDPGAFAHFDLNRVNSPAFVVDAAKLRDNLRVLADIGEHAIARIDKVQITRHLPDRANESGDFLGRCSSAEIVP